MIARPCRPLKLQLQLHMYKFIHIRISINGGKQGGNSICSGAVASHESHVKTPLNANEMQPK